MIVAGFFVFCLTLILSVVNFAVLPAVFRWSGHFGATGEFGVVLAGAIIVGELTIPVVWCAFSRSPLLWRMAAFYVAFAVISMFRLSESPFVVEWLQLSVLIVLAQVLPLLLFRIIWPHVLVHVSEVDDSTEFEILAAARQFSIRDIGAVTVITLVSTAAITSYFRNLDRNQFLAGLPFVITMFVAGYIFFISLLATIPLLGIVRDQPTWKFAFVPLAAASVHVFAAAAMSGDRRDVLMVFLADVTIIGLNTLSLLVMRMAGLRLRTLAQGS